MVIKDAQPTIPDEIWISVIVSQSAEVYRKGTERLEVLYYHCTLQWLQLTSYFYSMLTAPGKLIYFLCCIKYQRRYAYPRI